MYYYRVPLALMAAAPRHWIAMGVIGVLAVLSGDPDLGRGLERAVAPAVVGGLAAAMSIIIAIYAIIAVFFFVAIALVLRWMCRSD